jgi:multidrug transporter EmrE-like cation transporter
VSKLVDHLLILCAVAALSYTQLMLKWQANTVGAPEAADLARYLLRMLLNPWTLSALIAAAAALPLWLVVLGRLPLGYAYPFLSLSFVIVALGSTLLLQEPVNALRLSGLALIVLGVILVGRSQA